MLDSHLQATIDTYFRAVSCGDEETFAACLAPEVLFSGSLSAVQGRGHDALRGAYRTLRSHYPDLRQEPYQTFGVGPEVAVLVDLYFDENSRAGHGGIWLFHFDSKGRVERLTELWDAQPMLLQGHRFQAAADLAPAQVEAQILAVLKAYFQTFNAGDEEAHMALFSPEVAYYGSVSRIASAGTATVRGIFRSARDTVGIRRLIPLQVLGRRDQLAVLLTMDKEDAAGSTDQGVWVFRFDDRDRIDGLSVLWNPGAFVGRPRA